MQGEVYLVEELLCSARLENFKLDNSVVGDVVQGLEDRARATAAGRITEALVQIGIPTARGAKIATNNSRENNKSIKTGKRVSLKNKNISKAARIANKTGRGAVVVGGGARKQTVYEIEDIGTFGDMFFDQQN